jgi:hypothetical protein
MMLVRALPCALLWPAAMIVWGPGLVSARHKHHSIQLVMAIEGRLRIRSGPKCPWMECGAAVVDANAPHEVDAADAQVVLAFADPKSDVGAALRQAVQQNITLIQDDIVASWRRQLGGSSPGSGSPCCPSGGHRNFTRRFAGCSRFSAKSSRRIVVCR